MTARGAIIAAASSGSGKTTVTLALLALLAQRGHRVASCKVGPDYIDPAFHAVELISAWLKNLLWGNGSDLAAGWLMMACLMIIIGVHARLVRRRSFARLGFSLVFFLLPVFSIDFIVNLTGHEVLRIDSGKIRPSGGFASRIRLDSFRVAAHCNPR